MSLTRRERGKKKSANVASECLRFCTPKIYKNTRSLSIWWVVWFGCHSAKGYKPVVSQAAAVWQRHDKLSRKYVADENASQSSYTLHLSYSLHPLLPLPHNRAWFFHRIQPTLCFLFDQTLEDMDYEECVCSTVKLPTLQVVMYLKDHSQWFCFNFFFNFLHS